MAADAFEWSRTARKCTAASSRCTAGNPKHGLLVGVVVMFKQSAPVITSCKSELCLADSLHARLTIAGVSLEQGFGRLKLKVPVRIRHGPQDPFAMLPDRVVLRISLQALRRQVEVVLEQSLCFGFVPVDAAWWNLERRNRSTLRRSGCHAPYFSGSIPFNSIRLR